jgi:uncharacterized protein (TIGR02246 family)
MSGQAGSANAADTSAIDRVREAHIGAMNQGNVDAFVGVFSEDAVQMPPNFPANTGRGAIRGWITAFLEPFRVQFALEVEEVRVAGDWQVHHGLREAAQRGLAGCPGHLEQQ